MTPRALGALIALVVLAADQAAKLMLLARFGGAPAAPTPLAPFVDLALGWNRGISFSLFTQETALGRATLIGVTLAAIAALGWWLATSRSRLAAAGLGAIVGGALGNALDRLTHGAVVDYLDLHAFGRHFFVFNLADAAISLGVVLLAIDLVFGERPSEARPAAAERPKGR